MNFKTEELLVITLAIVIFIAIFITISPSFTGYTIYTFSNFTCNDNFIINETIQLKQHSYTENTTTQETYYFLTFAEENGKTKLTEISQKDDKFVELDSIDIFKIKFDNALQNQDKFNMYLANTEQRTFYVCDFNAINSCENETIYSSFNYPGIEGHYQLTLTLPEPTNEFAIYSADGKLKFDYINASHTETTESIVYYYNSDSTETERIQPENLDKWDIFTADYTLNNQTINFYYKTNNEFIEFIPPYNFSSINSSFLKFKLDLISDNSSTPIVYNLSINYLEIKSCTENWTCTDWNECINEIQTRTCIDSNECGTSDLEPEEEQDCIIEESEEETPSSSNQAPSLTRYKSSLPIITTATAQTKSENIETKTVSLPIELKTAPESQPEIEIKKSNIKIIGNTVAVSYLLFLCLLLYKKRHKL